MEIDFKKHPVRWVYVNLIWKNLPLMWKAKAAMWHMNSIALKRKYKIKLLGELIPVTVSVIRPWQYVRGVHTQTRVREINYRWKRKKLPFAYPKVLRGIQCTDETATPLKITDFNIVAKSADAIYNVNQYIHASNEKYYRQQKLKDDIINHKFKEYDHDK